MEHAMCMLSFRSFRAHALGVALILALLTWFYWPSLSDGLFADDYVAMAMMEGSFAAPRGPLDLFNFGDGTAEDVRALRRLGSLPWWAPDDHRLRFLRPLSSATWQLDRLLFGRHYGAYHAHSLLVFFALVVSASLLYRRLFSPAVALLATAIFALDDSHRFPVLWLSNRGGIYALLFGVLALHAHLAFRESRRGIYACLCALSVSVGLLFGEWVIPMLAYIAAYELVAARGSWRRRALSLLPSVAPAVLFLTARAALHYGARGSGAYVDPGVEPARFALSVVHRVPVFFADMFWNVPSEWWDHGTPWRDRLLGLWIIPPELWVQLPGWHFFHLGLGIAALLALGWGVYFCWRNLSEDERRHLRFLLLASVAALIPMVGSFPSTRLTIAAYCGLAPLFALVLREVAQRLRALTYTPTLGFALKLTGYAVLLGAIFHMQLEEPLQANVQGQCDHYASTREWVAAADLDPKRVATQRVFLLAGSEFTTTFFFSYIWAHEGGPLPRSFYPITTCPCAHYVERSADNELVLRALGTSYLGSGEENMFHPPRRVWAEGEAVQLDGLRVRAENVVDGLPTVLRLTFDRSLEDPSYAFLIAAPFGLVRPILPALGEQTLLARAADPSWIEIERHRFVSRLMPVPEMLHYGSFPPFLMYEPGAK
jgi:hypothetical protein